MIVNVINVHPHSHRDSSVGAAGLLVFRVFSILVFVSIIMYFLCVNVIALSLVQMNPIFIKL